MTNIEFIEQFIKGTELTLNTYIQLQKEELSHPDIYDKSIEITKKELQHLQQIKAKLEAWEAVKDYIDIFGYIGSRGDLVEYIKFSEDQIPDLEHIEKVKKAKELEVNKNE